jgi:hypothetical protein
LNQSRRIRRTQEDQGGRELKFYLYAPPRKWHLFGSVDRELLIHILEMYG